MLRIVAIAVILTVAAVATALVACSGQRPVVSSSPAPANGDTSLANGRAIFLTGRDIDGVQIVAQTSPLADNCAACHRADGSGGKKFRDGAVSADLRHRALVTEQKHPYTLALLERAISTGIDNEGQPLDRVMPHWRLTPRDLHDVAEYVFLKLK